MARHFQEAARRSRRRRAPAGEGSESRSLSDVPTVEVVSELIDRQRERARSWEDPVRTLHEVEELVTHLSDRVDELRADLPPAVRALRRRGWTFERIAAESGVPVARVIELARESRARRL